MTNKIENNTIDMYIICLESRIYVIMFPTNILSGEVVTKTYTEQRYVDKEGNRAIQLLRNMVSQFNDRKGLIHSS